MRLKAALNGARAPGEHPALPLRPHELAEAAAAALEAGADAIHFHVRGTAGGESLDAADVSAAMIAVRSGCGTAPVGISTGAWIVPDPAARVAAVRTWGTLPDFASVNFHESGATEVADALRDLGIGVEAGLASAHAARLLVRSGAGAVCLRVLLEPADQPLGRALAAAAEIEAVLDAAGIACPRLLHGTDSTAWPLLRAARRRGYAARIGLEDTLRLPGGDLARDNRELVSVALEELHASSEGVRIELAPLDQPSLAALSADPAAYAARHEISLGPSVELIKQVAAGTMAFMQRDGAFPPWAGYLAVDASRRVVIGTCAYKGPPDADGMVEVAYFTFPSWEGRGYATAMASALRDLAARSGVVRVVRAHTLPETNASGHILRKLGFRFVGEAVDPDDGLVWRWDWVVPAS
jgi:uncharacterized protein (DUF849 family)/RimJ/RimL family protein N-acetyltransferase